jgi:2-amino-4-hydroxy-6-hydroxymethyldihydropteridine diphosphokinase
LQTARWAATQLDGLLGLRLRALSRWYLTEPVPPSGQALYVNGIALLVGGPEADPAALLAELQAVEAHAGRIRTEPNAARTLDLDIIAMGECGQTVRAAPDPVLPHPRAHRRAFVLAPLLDVVPDWRHPLTGRSARDLLKDVSDQEIELLGS